MTSSQRTHNEMEAGVEVESRRRRGEPVLTTSARRALRRTMLWLGIAAATATVATGAVFVVDSQLSSGETRTLESYDAVPRLVLVADGEVTVRSGDEGTGIQVDVVAQEGLAGPEYAVEESRADRLVLTHRCDAWGWISMRCEGELHATVPPGTAVTVRASNGSVRAAGVTGALDLESSNGAIEVSGTRGDVDAHASNGTVVVAGTTGSVDADSSNGDVTVRAATGDVEATSSNGSVTVHGTGRPVQLEIETANGEETIEAPTDPTADHTVVIRSSNGDVSYLAPGSTG